MSIIQNLPNSNLNIVFDPGYTSRLATTCAAKYLKIK